MRPAPWSVRLVPLIMAAVVSVPREADAQVFTPKVTLAGHKGGGGVVCFSADGSLLATRGFKDGNVKLWEVATGHERATFKTGGEIYHIASAPKANVLAVVSRTGKTRGRRETSNSDIVVLDLDTAKARTLSIAVPRVHSIAYSPDGKTLAVCSYYEMGDTDRGRLAFLDAATGQVRATLMEGQPFACAPAFSRDGSTLATGSWDGFIRLWDVKTAKKLATLHDSAHWKGTRHTEPVFSPDGKHIASYTEDKTVRVWYLSSLDPIVTLKGVREPVAYSPDGKFLATGCVDKTLMLWDAKTFVERAKIDAHDGGFNGVLEFSPDGKLLATNNGDGMVKIWEWSHLLSGGSPAPVPAPTAVKARSGDRK